MGKWLVRWSDGQLVLVEVVEVCNFIEKMQSLVWRSEDVNDWSGEAKKFPCDLCVPVKCFQRWQETIEKSRKCLRFVHDSFVTFAKIVQFVDVQRCRI